MEQVTLKNLAEKLNLSVSTVSKALRNGFDISADTKQKVLALAEELNYQPNVIASSLRTNKSKTIAVIIPEIANNFFHLAINGIESISTAAGYHVLIYLTHEDYKKEVVFTQLAERRRVDGIIMSLSQQTTDFSHLTKLIKGNIPLVFFDRVYEKLQAPMVSTNDAESSYKATKHLIEQGCKHIAHFTFGKNPSIALRRKEGYEKALCEYGLPINSKLILHSTGVYKDDVRNIKALLTKNKKLDGIFSAQEKMTMLSYRVCNELKIQIPENIKIISFSNLDIASLLTPPLSTVTQPAYQIGKSAASLLFKILQKGSTNLSKKHLVLDSELIIRQSSLLNVFFLYFGCIVI